MKTDDIKKILQKVVNYENDTKTGEKSKKLKVSDNKTITTKYVEPFSK